MKYFFPLLVLLAICTSCIEEKEQLASLEVAMIEFKFRTDPTSSKSDVVVINATSTDTENIGIVSQVDGFIDTRVVVDKVTGNNVFFYSLSPKGRSEVLIPNLEKEIVVTYGYALFSDGCFHYGTILTDTVTGVEIFFGRGVGDTTGLQPICPQAGGPIYT
jgi:hypothetical protein